MQNNGRLGAVAPLDDDEELTWNQPIRELFVSDEDGVWISSLPDRVRHEEVFRRYEAAVLWVRSVALSGVVPPQMSRIGRVAWRLLHAQDPIFRTPEQQESDRRYPSRVPRLASSISER